MRRPSFLLTAVVGSVVLGAIGLRLCGEPVVLPAPGTPEASHNSKRDLGQRLTPEVEVARRVRDSVVNIHSERTAMGNPSEDFFALAPTQHRINGMGTGIVIDPRGYVVTNHHVIEEVNTIRVRLADGTAVPARIVARDRENDLALLKVDAGRPLTAITLGTASDLMVGEKVIAVGNAYGYDHTVTSGIVSAVGRDVTLNKEIAYKSLIQTDAAINPGNSGGPLLNVYGELVGVNVAIRAGAQNIGFAIPVDTMIRVASGMLARKAGGATHSLVVHDDVRQARDEGFVRRVVVDEVSGGAGAKAGMQPGDVLVRVGEVPVLSSLDLERAMLDQSAGDRVPVVFRRGNAEQHGELVLDGVRLSASGGDPVWRRLGLRLQPVGAESVSKSQPQLHGGLLIADVRPDSSASKAGLQRGDILIGLHQWETLTTDSVQWVLNHPDLATFNPLKFYVLRAGQMHRGYLQASE
jgi:serine protease Do